MKLLREPLLHFLIAGVGLFVAYAWVGPREGTQGASPQREIRFSEGDLRWATETWKRQWQKNPSREELRGLVRDLLNEELLAREAREMGLDTDDTVVRRRLAQKMTFLIEDTSRLAEPTEDELRQFYEAHPEKFRREARVSFMQLFFNHTTRSSAAADARQALVELASATNPKLVAEKGDQLLIEPSVNDADESSVAAQFGQDFARAVFTLEPGAWHGPIKSAYGLHLVRVSEFTPAEQRPFLEVRDQVLDRWREQRRQEATERYFGELFKKYEIVADEGVEAVIGPLSVEAGQAR